MVLSEWGTDKSCEGLVRNLLKFGSLFPPTKCVFLLFIPLVFFIKVTFPFLWFLTEYFEILLVFYNSIVLFMYCDRKHGVFLVLKANGP